MEAEMVKLRDLLKKEVDLLEKAQNMTELEKCSLVEKLEMSQRRCEELGMRLKKMESDKAAAQRRLHHLEPKMLNDMSLEAEGCVVSDDHSGGNFMSNKGASYPASARCHCNLKVINVIKNNLHKENLETFEQLCFGSLLKINEFKFQGQLIKQLLLQMDMKASNKGRLVFKINNSNIEFGPREFFHITGLRFGKLEACAATSSMYRDVFKCRPNISLTDIEEAFINISRRDNGKGELTLKLSLLYFLYGTLLVRRCYQKIDLQYLHSVEDLQKFNAFPWGRVAYELLVSSILLVRANMDSSKSKQNERKLLSDDDQMLHAQPSSAATPTTPPPPSTYPLHHLARRLSRAGGAVESLLRKFDQPVDNLPRNQFPWVDDEEDSVSAATMARHSTSRSAPISMDKATDKLAPFKRSSLETERATTHSDTPQLLWMNCCHFEISESGYERGKALYEMLLDRKKHLNMWNSYAKFEAFAMIEGLQIRDNKKGLQRARAVFERGLSYFRSCDPELKVERAMLLEEWFDMEYRFGEVGGDVDSVRAKLPQKLKKRRRTDGTAGYEEYVDYLFPEEKRSSDVKILEAAYKWKKLKSAL